MFKQLSSNLNLLMEEVHISADELARRTGVPASTIKKIRNNNNPNPTLTTLIPLADYFLVKLGQLVGSEPLPDSRIKGLYKTKPESLKHLPIISWSDAVDWPKKIVNTYPKITSEFDFSEEAYALFVEEDNWENLSKGTVLLVDPEVQPEYRDYIIVLNKNYNTADLKQLIPIDDKNYLKPVIQGNDIIYFSSDYIILGVVVEYKKHLKK